MANELNNLIIKYPPAAYYRFTSGALTTDSSDGVHTLSKIGFCIDGTPKFGGAVGIGSVNAYSAIDHADFQPSGNFSVSAWIKVGASGGTQGIFQSYSQATNLAGIGFYVFSNNKLVLLSAKNTGVIENIDYKLNTSTNTVTDGNWHFVVGTWDGAKLHLYIDGAEEGTGVDWTYAPVFAGTNHIRIGCRSTTGSNLQNLYGALDDVSFWNGKALSLGEVTTLYSAELNTVPALLGDSALKAYYRFEDGALTTDTTANAHTLAVIGYPVGLTTKFDGFVYLPNTSAYSAVDHLDFKPAGNFTIGVWIKTVKTGVARYLFQSFSQNPKLAGFYLTTIAASNTLFFATGKNTGTVQGTDYQRIIGGTIITDGDWHFVVATYDGTNLNLYVDGKSDATPVTWANAPAYAATNYVRVGCANLVGSNVAYFEGTLDDVFLLNGRALTLEEVNELFLTNYILKQEIGDNLLQETGYRLYLDGIEYKTLVKSLKYTVKIPKTAIDKSLIYGVAGKYIKIIDLTYLIVAAPTAITKDLTYTVLVSPTAITKDLKYTIPQTSAPINKGLTYMVITTPFLIVNYLKTEDGDYLLQETGYRIILEALEKNILNLTYHVASPASINKSLKYVVVAAAAAITKSIKYTVVTTSTPVNKSLEYAVEITMPAVTKSLKYTISSPYPVISKSLRYTVASEYSQTKSLKYVVLTTPTAVTKSLTYRVVSPVFITKSMKYLVKSLLLSKITAAQVLKPKVSAPAVII